MTYYGKTMLFQVNKRDTLILMARMRVNPNLRLTAVVVNVEGHPLALHLEELVVFAGQQEEFRSSFEMPLCLPEQLVQPHCRRLEADK